MQDLRSLEIFEMEFLEYINSLRLLDSLYFGGGTMLRLCHNLNRFSTDLDFWIEPAMDSEKYYQLLSESIPKKFEIIDQENKKFTILFQLRSSLSKRTLKIEIRKDQTGFEWERKIAFSMHAAKQVQVKGLTLAQMMNNKVAALLSRKLIRDCYDMEFIFKRGIALPKDKSILEDILTVIASFKDRDYKVILGSLLEPEERSFYIQNKFSLLTQEITALLHR